MKATNEIKIEELSNGLYIVKRKYTDRIMFIKVEQWVRIPRNRCFENLSTARAFAKSKIDSTKVVKVHKVC